MAANEYLILFLIFAILIPLDYFGKPNEDVYSVSLERYCITNANKGLALSPHKVIYSRGPDDCCVLI